MDLTLYCRCGMYQRILPHPRNGTYGSQSHPAHPMQSFARIIQTRRIFIMRTLCVPTIILWTILCLIPTHAFADGFSKLNKQRTVPTKPPAPKPSNPQKKIQTTPDLHITNARFYHAHTCGNAVKIILFNEQKINNNSTDKKKKTTFCATMLDFLNKKIISDHDNSKAIHIKFLSSDIEYVYNTDDRIYIDLLEVFTKQPFIVLHDSKPTERVEKDVYYVYDAYRMDNVSKEHFATLSWNIKAWVRTVQEKRNGPSVIKAHTQTDIITSGFQLSKTVCKNQIPCTKSNIIPLLKERASPKPMSCTAQDRTSLLCALLLYEEVVILFNNYKNNKKADFMVIWNKELARTSAAHQNVRAHLSSIGINESLITAENPSLLIDTIFKNYTTFTTGAAEIAEIQASNRYCNLLDISCP
jgi:hypothetical protein